MLVCHCHAVCDRKIRECIRQGARSAEEIGQFCGAGGSCGGCLPTIEGLLAIEQADRRDHAPFISLDGSRKAA